MKPNKHIHGFRVPEDYFDNLEERIMQNVSTESLPKETGMQVPEDYFEHLESRIVDHWIKSKTRRKPKLVRINTWRHVAAAACVIGFALWLIPEKPETNAAPENFVSTDYSLKNYMEDMVLEMPDSSLYSLMDNIDIDYTNGQTPFRDKINKEEVEEYLIENLDLSTLLSYE